MPAQSARQLPAAPLRNLKVETPSLRIPKADEFTCEQALEMAAEIFDESCIRAGLNNKFIAQHLGVSDSLVARWRLPHTKDRATVAQMLRLPGFFLLALHKVLGQRFGARKAAMAALLDAVADLAAADDEQERTG